MGVGASAERAVGAFAVGGIGATVVALAVTYPLGMIRTRVGAARRRQRRWRW